LSEAKTGVFGSAESVSPEQATEASWNALLDVYKFSRVDELDLVLLQGAQNGFFDEGALRVCAQVLNDQIMANRSDNSFSEAWDLYHDSFDDNKEQVLDAIYTAFKNSPNRVALTTLNSIVDLFKVLGRGDQAQEMIETFVQSRGDERSAFDLKAFPFAESVTDPDVIAALNKKLATFPTKKDPKAILITISETSSWHPNDVRDLASLPVQDYYELLKSSRGYDLRHIINACLKFDGASPEMAALAGRLKEALTRIGKESDINARRVRRYGITVDPKSKGAEDKN
jgi:hypothetical protein